MRFVLEVARVGYQTDKDQHYHFDHEELVPLAFPPIEKKHHRRSLKFLFFHLGEYEQYSLRHAAYFIFELPLIKMWWKHPRALRRL